MQLTLPSGLAGDVRKIKGIEINAMAAQADGVGEADGGFSTLLGGCWLGTTDRGPYPPTRFKQVGDKVTPLWGKILKGDLLAGIVFLRQVSLTDGDEYDFDVQCQECRKPIQWSLRLSHLPIRPLPEASAERLRAGEPFEARVDGRVVLFDLQCMEQEEPIARLMKQQKRMRGTIVDVLAGQVRSVDGVAPGIKARWEWISSLDMDQLYELQAQMEDADCGVETETEVICKRRECQEQQRVNLPFGRRFFSPKKRRPDPSAEDLDGPAGEAPPATGAPSSAGSPASGGGAPAPGSGGASTGAAATPA